MIALQTTRIEQQLELEQQIHALIEQIKSLTTDCQQAVNADEPGRLIIYLDKRQQCMEKIDSLRARQRDLSTQPADPEEITTALAPGLIDLQDSNRQQLLEILAMDETMDKTARETFERYRAALLEVRNQRCIQAYERDLYASSRFLDIKE